MNEIEELERKVTGSDNVIAAEARSVETLPDQKVEDRRNFLPKMGAEEQADSPDEKEHALIHSIKFLSPEVALLLCKSTICPVVTPGLMPLVATWKF